MAYSGFEEVSPQAAVSEDPVTETEQTDQMPPGINNSSDENKQEQELFQQMNARMDKLEERLFSIQKRMTGLTLEQKHSEQKENERQLLYSRLAGKPTTFLLGVGCTLLLIPVGSFLLLLIWKGLIVTGTALGVGKNLVLAGLACAAGGGFILSFASSLAKLWVKLIYEEEDDQLDIDIDL